MMTSHEDHLDMGEILCFRTNQFLAFNKPAGIAVQGKSQQTLHQLANGYAKRKLFMVHRIDQPASGLVLFARTPNAAAALGDMFKKGEIRRKYFAVVQGNVQDEDTLTHQLLNHPQMNKVEIGQEEDGKSSSLTYRRLHSSDHYHLLAIELHSGRKHQIRAQLSAAGFPIKGDRKYGAKRGNRDARIHLHAHSLEFKHFISGEPIKIVAPLPIEDPLWKFFSDSLSEE